MNASYSDLFLKVGGDGVMLFLYYILFFLGNAMLAVGMSFVGVWLSARSNFINAMRSHDGAEDISDLETEMDEAKRSMQKRLFYLSDECKKKDYIFLNTGPAFFCQEDS